MLNYFAGAVAAGVPAAGAGVLAGAAGLLSEGYEWKGER